MWQTISPEVQILVKAMPLIAGLAFTILSSGMIDLKATQLAIEHLYKKYQSQSTKKSLLQKFFGSSSDDNYQKLWEDDLKAVLKWRDLLTGSFTGIIVVGICASQRVQSSNNVLAGLALIVTGLLVPIAIAALVWRANSSKLRSVKPDRKYKIKYIFSLIFIYIIAAFFVYFT